MCCHQKVIHSSLLLVALSVHALCGCGSVSPPKEVARVTPTLSFQETVMLLGEMTEKCWRSKVNPLKDGIVLSSYGNAQSKRFIVAGYSVNWGVGLAKEPFIVVTVTQSSGKALVAVHEGDFSVGLGGPFRLDAAAHVTAWLNGERECKEFATTLWHS